MRVGLKLILLHARAIGGGDGRTEMAVGGHNALPRLTAHILIRVVQIVAQGAFAQGLLRAVGHGHVREGHVHAGQHTENVIGSLLQFTHHSQQLFLCWGQGVGLIADQAAHKLGILRHIGRVLQRDQLRLRQGEQLRLHEGKERLALDQHSHGLALNALCNAVAVVRFLPQRSDPADLIQLFSQCKISADHALGVLRNVALTCGQRLDLLHDSAPAASHASSLGKICVRFHFHCASISSRFLICSAITPYSFSCPPGGQNTS